MSASFRFLHSSLSQFWSNSFWTLHIMHGFTTTHAISAYSPLKWWVRIQLMANCNRYNIMWYICLWLEAGWWFSPGTLISSTNKSDRHDITEILLKIALNTISIALLCIETTFSILKHLMTLTCFVNINVVQSLILLRFVVLFGLWPFRLSIKLCIFHLSFFYLTGTKLTWP
jgi:energy-converting hydrogenase Eha subunit E